ncbi:purple acid phosphatase 2-like isoform X5 [Gastrolobium bilobum]|uniref:purple acid phosphatase 2-like isoform X5 n=1 Tax=Gastrolobium bilobum TaxID=150636 RepID=UPI002AB29DC6|nr:purple acid phosphatase 2-like isoform X5 [Gastrolobium bilobum]
MGLIWHRGFVGAFLLIVLVFLFSTGELRFCIGGKTSTFMRNDYLSLDMPIDSDVFRVPPGYNAPQQVHITQGDHVGKGVIISWITPDEPGSSTVIYWAEDSKFKWQAYGFFLTYKYFNYTSGYIHHCTIQNLETLTHYELSPAKGQTILYVGDLSYADDYPFHDNTRWDTWGRFTERIAAYQPWIWTAGNHEIDFAPELYQIVHLHCGTLSRELQHTSLLCLLTQLLELPKVNRTETPWLIVLMHCPIYSSYVTHYMEGETVRVMYEKWFVEYKVDVVFAGHVHAYERSERVSNIAYDIVNGLCRPINDQSAPVYITIGDGGNLEGLATDMTEPQPSYSAYREASFGHGTFDIKNRTHAHFSWNRNQDGYAVEADFIWLHNRYWSPPEESSSLAIK